MNNNLPVLVTRNNYIFPTFESILEIGRPKSLKALDTSIKKFNSQIILLNQCVPIEENPTIDKIYKSGVLVTFKIQKSWDDGSKTIGVKSLSRVRVKNLQSIGDDEYTANYEIIVPIIKNPEQTIMLFKQLLKAMDHKEFAVHYKFDFDNNKLAALESVIDGVATSIEDLSNLIKQKIISTKYLDQRVLLLFKVLNKDTEQSEVDQLINKKMQHRVNNQQREFILREKLKAIQEELDQINGKDDNGIKKYISRLNNEPFPEHIKNRLLSEIQRYQTLPPSSSEGNLLITYIDVMMSIPWWEKTEDKDDLTYALNKLNENHYGLEKVKKRIIEHLAVKTLTKKMRGHIICLVGPPGVGKTSLAKSIASATQRVFVKVSLGGIRDEAEIRGHRKTYIGAMPGRIIQAMKKAKAINPVFLLDEIDKLSSDYHGDPASAMLEVLDPEQNKTFSDHYVEEEYDLSNVMFIATANYYENIPETLIDRMEIIHLSSYTELEKMEITKNHLIKKIINIHGLKKSQLKFKDEALLEIIQFYTREAGVRQLERDLSSIARKFIVKFLKKEIKTLTVNKTIVNKFLGKRIFNHTLKEEKSQVGVVTGLAYTQYGGDILPIEVNYFVGKGNLILTGKLGDIMKESASIALDYIKANAEKFKLAKFNFESHDIHIHVPEGAVPKDGPSAGITITTSLISALTKQPVSREIGMTGEITLRGHVLPIGGLKEKSISANRSGLKTIIIPDRNKRDIIDIPKEVQENLKILFVHDYLQVYKLIFN